MNITDIATAFSNGAFAATYPYLSDQVVWIVVGEKTYAGKTAVTKQCEQVQIYFESVQTDFKTIQIITEAHKVVISGTAAFSKEGQLISFISACDIYEFNARQQLEKITSYCIPEKGI
ncbi:hypothetical protein DBR32_06860 [Taibaiella sp. KBW10]|uniref:nuclear transport factor 2 family protein n=1 Tax=Taibaiella sp. KBW10 TaxID=2153357 RepID=UPI000F5AE14F|nr:nuclear transport factor 2 family protein [Taibaiella sp. KBW10]RQO31662.1 hypothetical protein DBR32_06860 [Taibaiella sp. KBW10]